jgi:hypothetical protein
VLGHEVSVGDVSLCLYDVTTLYFETDEEDALRRVGYSKERRVDPQVVVGLLIDRRGATAGCEAQGSNRRVLALPEDYG